MIRKSDSLPNPILEQLRQQIAEAGQSQIDWLVVAHDDTRMLHELEKAFANQSLAVVAIPQSYWAMNEETADEMLALAVNELQVNGILLVGHSQGGTPNTRIRVSPHANGDRTASQPATSLMDRIRLAQEHVGRCEQHFAQQLELVGQQDSVAKSLADEKLTLQGLFYRAESGVFCVFNSQTQSFRALIPQECIA